MKCDKTDTKRTIFTPPTEHARFKGKKASPDYTKLLKEAIYKNEYLGNIMFNGKLIQASANFGCFMTLNVTNPASGVIPEAFRVGNSQAVTEVVGEGHIIFFQRNYFHHCNIAKLVDFIFMRCS